MINGERSDIANIDLFAGYALYFLLDVAEHLDRPATGRVLFVVECPHQVLRHRKLYKMTVLFVIEAVRRFHTKHPFCKPERAEGILIAKWRLISVKWRKIRNA